MVSGLPPTFQRLVAGDTLEIGGRSFDVLTGNGHAPEQVMLYCAADKLFLAADQVLAKITPNISVWAVEPDGDPLGLYLRSLRELKAQIPADVLVLPGHQLPFHGLHTRSDELIAHHEPALRHDRRSLPPRAPHGRRAGAGPVPPRPRPAPDELRLQRGAWRTSTTCCAGASWPGRRSDGGDGRARHRPRLNPCKRHAARALPKHSLRRGVYASSAGLVCAKCVIPLCNLALST